MKSADSPTPTAATPPDLHPTIQKFGKDLTEIQFRKCLVFLCLLGLVIRVGFFVEHSHSPSFGVPTLDQKYYDTVARMLLAGEDLHELHGFRPLLYPMFLAGCYKLGGTWGIDLALFLQHLLGIATGLIAALLGARLFRHKLCGILGGILYLLAPVPLYFEGELLIEPSYIFLIFLCLLLLVHAAESTGFKSAALWTLCGALTILASQARANILIFMAVFPLFAALRWWCSANSSALLPLLGLLGGLIMAIPWGFVNLRQSDHFHLMPNAGGVALYLGNKPAADGMVPEQERRIATGERYQDSVEVWAREEYESAMRADGKTPDTDPMAISRYWTRRTIDEIKAHPATWSRLMLKKTWLTFWNAEIPNNKAFAFLQQEFFWLRFLPVRWAVLLAFAPVGIWAAARGNQDAFFILLVYAGLYSAANVMFFICDRYRYPVWPVMAIFAGGGLRAFWNSIRTRNHRAIFMAAASALLMLAISLPNWFQAKMPSFARDYLFRSIAWYEKGHFDEALDDINHSLELDASDATAFQQRGNACFALNHLVDARQSYSQALKLSPNEGANWNNLGAVLLSLGQTNDALQAFRRATECRPPSRNAFLSLAFTQIQLGHMNDAADSISQLEKQSAKPDAAVMAAQSVLARRQNDSAKADALERQARELDPKLTDWVIQRAGSTGPR